MSRGSALVVVLALAAYGTGLAQPLLTAVRAPAPERQVQCHCSSACGCRVAYHGSCDAAADGGVRLYGACPCGCSGRTHSEHGVDVLRVSPHLTAGVPWLPPQLVVSAAARVPVPGRHSAAVEPPDKIPI